MRTIFAFLFIACCVSYQPAKAQDSLCTSFKKLVKDLPNNFKNVKGAFESEDGGSKYYTLKGVPDGWTYGNCIVEGKTASLMLLAATEETEEAGKEKLKQISKAITSCMGVKGKEENNSFGDPTITFTKGNAKVTLLLSMLDDKYNINMFIEKTD